jgi:hypothetical protein
MDDDVFDWVDCMLREDMTPPARITELKMKLDESVTYETKWKCNITLEYSDASAREMEADVVALKSNIDTWEVTDVKIHDTKEVSRIQIQSDLQTDYDTALSELIMETIHGENQ